MSTIGFLMTAVDNGTRMLNESDLTRCGTCFRVIERPAVVGSYVPPTDLGEAASYTNDGYLICESAVAEILEEYGAAVTELPATKGKYFAVDPGKRVEFDIERRRTRFEGLCKECGRYFDVIGATPIFLLQQAGLPDEIVGTDVEFGSGDEQHPLLLVGPRLGQLLISKKVSGLQLLPLNEEALTR